MRVWTIAGLLFTAAILATIPVSPQPTQRGVELRVDQAQAITYGRYRRATRRAYRRAGYAAAAGYTAAAAGYYSPNYGAGGYGYHVEPGGPGRWCAVYPNGFRWCWTEFASGPTSALNPQPLPPAPSPALNPQPLPPVR
jgi:hypothetical protein